MSKKELEIPSKSPKYNPRQNRSKFESKKELQHKLEGIRSSRKQQQFMGH